MSEEFLGIPDLEIIAEGIIPPIRIIIKPAIAPLQIVKIRTVLGHLCLSCNIKYVLAIVKWKKSLNLSNLILNSSIINGLKFCFILDSIMKFLWIYL